MKKLIDRFGRVHTYLRISITDKCNLNCIYCNPADSALRSELSRSILAYEEFIRLIKIFVTDLGITKIRLTGGEPLVRKNVENFFKMLKEIKDKHPFELGLTTNGILLEDKIDMLKNSGLDKINISLDTLRKERFIAITGTDNIDAVINSINKAEDMGYNPVKINAVIMREINDDEILDFIEFVKDRNLNIRFIEYMPFTSNGWNEKVYISYKEIKNIVEENYSLVEIKNGKHNVAKNFHIEGHSGTVSFISSISDHFCDGCNRLRVTASGNLKLCLFSSLNSEIKLKDYLHNDKITDDEIAELISSSLQQKELKHPELNELLTMDKNNMLRIGG
ncbi:MAG: GTP 3',8-cyclase MoaA [Ignavibacteria bacterium]|nr:GTP 3',8-cyclase MoaA [Ignavibacteria bacterium]